MKYSMEDLKYLVEINKTNSREVVKSLWKDRTGRDIMVSTIPGLICRAKLMIQSVTGQVRNTHAGVVFMKHKNDRFFVAYEDINEAMKHLEGAIDNYEFYGGKKLIVQERKIFEAKEAE